MLDGVVVEQVGGRLAYALPEAGCGGLQSAGFHLRGHILRLPQRGVAGFHGEHGLERAGRPCRVFAADPGEHVAHEVDRAPLVSRVRQHRVHRGHQPGAPVAHHEPHAPETAFDQAPDELLPAGPVLLHALRDPDDLPMARVVHADRDQHAHVLDRPAPRALVPHAVHEQVRVRTLQRPVAPFVDLRVHPLELVRERLRGHPLAPQQAADVVDLTGRNAGQVHVDQRLLDALLTTPVSFDHRRLEQRALELRDLEGHGPGLHGQVTLVMTHSVGLPVPGALVAGGARDLVRLRVQQLLDLLRHQPVESRLEHVLIDL